MVEGVLVVDKPAGPTSFEVVRRVREATGAAKAGHTGTLDPAATGVLAVCLGEAVKLQPWLVAADKAYDAEVRFGIATDTDDAEGRPVAEADASALDAARLSAALPRFVGEIEQVPPMYSAIRVAGRRLHEAARAGEEVERAPRRVRVDALELLAFEAGPRARARLAIRCGKGTYVRSLAADLGRALGLPAHLGALRRTAAGSFTLAQATSLDELERLGREDPAALARRALPLAEALGPLPAIRVDAAGERAIRCGQRLGITVPAPLARALAADGRLVALLEPAAGGSRSVRVFAASAAAVPAPGSR